MEPLKRVPDFRSRIQSYPVWSLLAIVALAYLCGAPRGQKDLAKFARQMSRGHRRALGIRRNRRREFPAPTQPTVKDNQAGIRRTVRTLFAATEAAFSPSVDHVHDGVDRREVHRRERRQIHTQSATPEQIGFPHVEQIARRYRHIGQHKPETVWLLTRSPKR